MKDYKGRNNFILRTNWKLEMSRSHAKIHLKSAPQKLKFVMAKSFIKKLLTRL